jgi:hypothetical protein
LLPHEPLFSFASCSHPPAPVQQPEHDPPPQLQAPFEHASPDAHAEQFAPPLPHWPLVCDP